MSPKAFIDDGYSESDEFLQAFLSSPDFQKTTLENILQGSRRLNKTQLASQIINKLNAEAISKSDILSAYIKQPSRQWLSLKLGTIAHEPTLKNPEILLTEFGEEDWYGPIKTFDPEDIYYIRIKKITDYYHENEEVKKRYIRWPVIAQISQNFASLSWNGFSFSELTDEPIDKLTQFHYWNYIPTFFDELAKLCQTRFEEPNLHELILTQMWKKYRNNKNYRWQHLRIRAESSGVALNAHSAGVTEIDIRGLQALSHHLAEAVAESLNFEEDSNKIHIAEDALIGTLIKDWGTKSYEFSLDEIRDIDDSEATTDKKTQSKKLFKAHCYFGLKPNSPTQDSLQHLKCNSSYGASTGILEFLLKELELRG